MQMKEDGAEEWEEDEINLRSEEVQEIMGRIPPWIERWGITLIGAVLMVTLAGAAVFPYPDTLVGRFAYIPKNTLNGKPTSGIVSMSAQGIGKVKKGQTVKVRLENYPDSEFGFLSGKVVSVSDFKDGVGTYKVYVCFGNVMKTSNGCLVPSNAQLEGNAEIVVAERRLVEKLKFMGIK